MLNVNKYMAYKNKNRVSALAYSPALYGLLLIIQRLQQFRCFRRYRPLRSRSSC